jgi:hypothetical protein
VWSYLEGETGRQNKSRVSLVNGRQDEEPWKAEKIETKMKERVYE